jgi:predicted RNA-binding protein
VAPKKVARAFSLRETAMSKNRISFVAANGSKIDNYGERKVIGHTDEGEGVTMRMTCADVQKVLGSVHRINMGGNRVMLDGDQSYMECRRTGRRTPIKYENGQYILYLWVPAVKSEMNTEKVENKGSRYAILAAEEEAAGFPRPARA